MIRIELTTTRQIKNPNTKTTYITESVTTEEVTQKQHGLATSKETLQWFRRLGGSETAQREYTCAGYLVTRLISTSPNKRDRIIREYKFTYED